MIFRTFFNPIDYNGQTKRDIMEAYQTNELGFGIGVAFALTICWSFFTYRKNAILESRKRLIFQ